MRRFIEYNWIPLTRTCFVSSLVETGSVVPEKAFILRWRKTWPFISKNVNLPLQKVTVCQIRLKLVIYIRRDDDYLGFFDSKRRKDDRTTKRIVKKKMAQITHNRNHILLLMVFLIMPVGVDCVPKVFVDSWYSYYSSLIRSSPLHGWNIAGTA
mgnify:CR=1 FL=1